MVWLCQPVALAISAVVAPSFGRRNSCLAALAGPGFLPGFRGCCHLLRAPLVPARSVFSRFEQNEASDALAPRKTSAPRGEGAVVLSSLRSNARAKNVRSQPSLELVTKKSRGVSVAISSGRSASTGEQTTSVSGRRSRLH